MQSIGRRYVQYINRAYRRTGSLGEGRQKSSVIPTENHFLTCMRYIELNEGPLLRPFVYLLIHWIASVGVAIRIP
jgi:hypothetical protein